MQPLFTVPVQTATMVVLDFSERLRAAMRRAGVDVRWLSNRLGVSYQAVAKVLNGGSKSMSASNTALAAEALGVNVRWLATGDGEMRSITIPVGLARETDTAIALGGVMSGPPGVAVDHTPRPPSLAEALEVVGMALAREMPECTRAELAEALSAWARYAGRDRYRQTVTELLDGDDANRTGTHG